MFQTTNQIGFPIIFGSVWIPFGVPILGEKSHGRFTMGDQARTILDLYRRFVFKQLNYIELHYIIVYYYSHTHIHLHIYIYIHFVIIGL